MYVAENVRNCLAGGGGGKGSSSSEIGGEGWSLLLLMFRETGVLCLVLLYMRYTYKAKTRMYKIIPDGPPIASNIPAIPVAPACISVAVAFHRGRPPLRRYL